jgi:hypothetical protein
MKEENPDMVFYHLLTYKTNELVHSILMKTVNIEGGYS